MYGKAVASGLLGDPVVALPGAIFEQFYKNCKIFREQFTSIEHHINARNIYTAFDFARLHTDSTKYEVWAQGNARAIDAALKPALNS